MEKELRSTKEARAKATFRFLPLKEMKTRGAASGSWRMGFPRARLDRARRVWTVHRLSRCIFDRPPAAHAGWFYQISAGTTGDYESLSTQTMNMLLLFSILCDASGSLALRGPISERSGDYAKMFKSFTNKSDESVGEACRDELAHQSGKNLCLILSVHVCHSSEKKGGCVFFFVWFSCLLSTCPKLSPTPWHHMDGCIWFQVLPPSHT